MNGDAAAPDAAAAAPGWRRLPRGVWALGFVSLFMDTSSELIHALLPLLLVDTLGVGVLIVGLIEGVAEATAAVTKLFSGTLSDRLGRRKRLAVAGYGLSALTKPLFPLADTAALIFAARFVDRIGKGIRGAPRDALIADITPPALRGAAYGVRQALDSAGAFAGPLLAVALMAAYGEGIRAALWWAVPPALLAVAIIAIAVREPDGIARSKPRGSLIRREELAALGPRYWRVVGIGVLFTLARFSEAFLILDGQAVGLPLTLVPLVMVAMNIAYAAAASPVGALSDRIGRTGLLVVGMLTLAVADLVLALPAGLVGLFAGAFLWGLHMALSQGLLAALVADTVPDTRRGTAFGLFNLATGLALLAASAVAGALWQFVGPDATFAAGAAFAVGAAMALRVERRRR